MAFQKFTVQAKTSASAGTGAKATLTKHKSGKSPASLMISLTTTVAAMLGWATGDKLEVLVGDGSDHGLIRLRKNNSVGTAEVRTKKAAHNGTYVSISLGHVPAFVDRRESARHINFDFVDEHKPTDWVEFVMPAWADETGPRAKPGVGGQTDTLRTLTRAVGKTRDVAPALLGDPEPGRREKVAALG